MEVCQNFIPFSQNYLNYLEFSYGVNDFQHKFQRGIILSFLFYIKYFYISLLQEIGNQQLIIIRKFFFAIIYNYNGQRLQKKQLLTKKSNNEKYKLKKEQESQQNQALIQSVSQFSAEQLLKFLEEKYQNYEQGSQKLFFKLNNQIGKRLMRIPSQIDEKQFKKMKNILLAQNSKITDEQIKFIFDKKYLPKNLLKVFAIVQYQTGEIIVMKLNFNREQPSSYVKKICIQKVPQSLYHFPLHKRMKKQGIQIIEGLFKYARSLDNYEKA